MSKQHRILIASDGSPTAQAALATALKFPWPASTRMRAIVARLSWFPTVSVQTRAAVETTFEDAALAAQRALVRRWPESKVMLVDAAPVDAILAEAEHFKATLIVLGWRGHGAFRRLLTGSVSRSVSAQAFCPVLIVREIPSAVRRFVVGFDGCPNAERALKFLGSLEPGRGSRVVLVNVIEPVLVPASIARFSSSMRADVRREVAAINAERSQQGQATLADGAARLARSGWTVKCEVRAGAPLPTLLKAVADHRADVLVLGARATNGLERALLGSVANGALNTSPVVLLVR